MNKKNGNNWTMETVIEFARWMKSKGGQVHFPVKELMNGYEIDVTPPSGQSAQEMLNQFDKEFVLNG